MNKVLLLGTSHPIQRGESSPEQFEKLIKGVYTETNFVGIVEEIDNGSDYIAKKFCNKNQLKYLCIEPDQQERTSLGIPSANEIVFKIIDEFDTKYPEICMWPSNPSQETLPNEVWERYYHLIESSYRARETEWLKRLTSLSLSPLLCICGASHFKPFFELLCANDIEVTMLSNDWEPSTK